MTSEDLDYRRVQPADAQALLALLQQLSQETTTFTVPTPLPSVSQEVKEIEQINAGKDHVVIVAATGEQLVGVVTVMPTDEQAAGEIGVAVLKKYWRQGIGYELMLSGLDWGALESSYSEISLTVQKQNTGAIAMYEKIGFATLSTSHVENSAGERVEAFEMAIGV
ncbi:hypothetical protein AYR62_03505 [Secundilactobacillus paracollinoides]|uniref:N-acetyltransferase domain-containing protein n=1 Tax=Secundilactobacillus paracollinoides TaxID=240427 RepID=A0A1B2IZV2_9LACO|nr:GNAT family N-acetyltransferase [Secundilactobacillus paracollinoides]ANZ61621.1 hypothetical protein AYR61_09780 [Secundilactobacillus paracollinoides]ANZ63261.1 hypothetical protein AYR62_03505 [Secundilactobacillus paracollinoides]ANZ67539.1 hypothetical protein AYR63_10525 [Secundilactobacillus paracollinoides]KRL80001.1 hypothetical protein FC17_GL000097 [Secundilactobacillus paracollinoides DSM 15502 = JCM 11969]